MSVNENFLEDFDVWVRGGRTPDEAEAALRKYKLPAKECSEIKAEYLQRNRSFAEKGSPHVLKGNTRIETWYAGPDFAGAWCWPAYSAMLKTKGWETSDFEALDQASTKIVAHLPHPGAQKFATRGLVVGYVQSGKTANYSALIAKAADVGYRLFIVLAGTTSSLRRQTQTRLQGDIVAHHPENWSQLTSAERDFSAQPGTPDSMINPANKLGRVLCVIKKNKFILTRLERFLAAANRDLLGKCPTLVIDDEADNASVNTSEPGKDRTAINEGILRVLARLPKAAYVGYTATPFANIFIDPTSPTDLFPRDFIIDLPRPKAYFGAEKIFGRQIFDHDDEGRSFDGLDLIRPVKATEPALLQPPKADDRHDFEPAIPKSLEEALRYFLLATACRYARGDDREHSSMLVHTSQYIAMHDKMQARLETSVEKLKRDRKKELPRLRKLWESEMARSRAIVTAGLTTRFADVEKSLLRVIDACQVVVDNGQPGGGLTYPKDEPRVYVAVGGNTLSRGLTLEGLVVSYFVRTTATYDTLLQMGRWFGYRPRYEDLPRVWMTDELEEHFFFLAGIEEEVRRDIERMEREGRTPLELAIRVRTHPKLQITAKSKMQNARLASASYSDRRLQSFLFRHRDREWLDNNARAGQRLLTKLPASAVSLKDGKYVARGVDVDLIVDFLERYRFHEDHDELRTDLLVNYVREETSAKKSALQRWNVAVLGQKRQDPHLGTMDLGLKSAFNCISRSRYRCTEPCNIKSLTSRPDRVVDLPAAAEADEAGMILRRNREAPGVGLLLMYPISKNSQPEVGKAGPCPSCGERHLLPEDGEPALRHPLNADAHVLGAALVFPTSTNGELHYVANDLGDLFDEGLGDPDVVGVQVDDGSSPELDE